jgi:1,4-alpha-glucan branching enzyme
MNIYEFILVPGANTRRHYFDYDKLAEELIPYLLRWVITHLELMPFSEYPFDGSGGIR